MFRIARRTPVVAVVLALASLAGLRGARAADAPPPRELTVAGTGFRLGDEPFPYTGVSFFNAIYNPAFNKSPEERAAWLAKFRRYGINVLRVWCQWDNKRGFADGGPDSSMYHPDGSLRPGPLKTLKGILTDAAAQGMVVELALFSQESWHDGVRLDDAAMDRAVEGLARELLPHRNLAFQVWNEFDRRVPEAFAVIKMVDPKRLVTNSPGFAGVFGSDEENRLLNYLTPHTSRQNKGKTWEVAPREVRGLIERFNKPVVDDEPARNGTNKFGGPKDKTYPTDHILHIHEVRKAGGHPTYHHDMFQTGYGSEAVPPTGVPDPEFSPYHRQVFEFLALHDRYAPPGTGAKAEAGGPAAGSSARERADVRHKEP